MEDNIYILNKYKRESNQHSKKVSINLNRVIPQTPLIFQTKNTKLIHTLANPLKKSIFYGTLIITLFISLVMCNILFFKYIYILFIIVIILYIYIAQSNNNEDVLHILKYMPENTTLYQYNKIVSPRQNNIQIVLFTIILLFIIRTVCENVFKELINKFK